MQWASFEQLSVIFVQNLMVSSLASAWQLVYFLDSYG